MSDNTILSFYIFDIAEKKSRGRNMGSNCLIFATTYCLRDLYIKIYSGKFPIDVLSCFYA